MARDVIHQLIWRGAIIAEGVELTTRCGIVACVETHGAFVVQMIGDTGSKLKATYYPDAVTCRKCINLRKTGTTHGKPSRTSDTSQRHPLGRRVRARTVRGA